MNGRVEDSLIGRFMSPDPRIPDATNPQAYNRYSYAINNPLTLIDPTGFDDCDQNDGPCQNTDPAPPVAACPDGSAPIDGACFSGTVYVTACAPFCGFPPLFGSLCAAYSLVGCPIAGGGPGGSSSGGSSSAGSSSGGSNGGNNNGNSNNNSPQCPKTSPNCLLPQTTQPNQCNNPSLWSRAGNALIQAGQWANNFGNSTSQAGSGLAIFSAVASAFGAPAEPGILLGGGIAAVGGTVSLVGSAARYVGGFLSGNSAESGQGFLGGTLGFVEGTVFDLTTARFGLPGLPPGIADPADSITNAGTAGLSGAGCP
jgi:hypothetical protein